MGTRASTEFPDFPDLDIVLPHGFADRSWHNDLCPFYAHKNGEIGLFVDHPDRAEREIPNSARFVLVRMKNGQHVDAEHLLATDDYAEILTRIAEEVRA